MMARREADEERSGAVGQPAEGRRGRGSRRNDESIVRSVVRRFQENDVLDLAAGIAYFAFLSLPPAIIVLFALTGFFGGDQVAGWVTGHLSEILPEEAAVLIDGFVESVVYSQAPGALSIGLLLALWAGSNVIMSIMRATNLAYGIEERRGFVRQRALAIGIMILFVLLFLSASAALLAGPQIGRALDPFGVVGALWGYVHLIFAFLVIVLAFWIAYYTLPARTQRGSGRQTLIGAAVAAALWLIATLGFRFYVGNFGSYDETYGALGAIIVLLIWLYLTGVVILLGAIFAAELEERGVG
jgi:membrane protein